MRYRYAVEAANQILHDFFKALRVSRCLSYADVAQGLDESPKNVEYWEKAPIKAPMQKIAQLLEFYGGDRDLFHEKMFTVSNILRQH